jgi:Kef-type K+ transport system membrane component KefB
MELGVLSLFFMVGLEVSEGLNSSRGLAVLRTVLLSALTPLLAWWPLQLGFGFPPGTTLLCIAVLSATGTGVTLRTLAQAGSLNSPSGRLLVGVSVLDDLPAIALLSLSMILGIGPQPALQAASPLPAALVLPPAIGLPVGLALAGGSLLACRLWRRKVGPWQAGPLEVLLLLIGCSWLGEVVGFTSLLGALWAGVLLSRLAPMVSTDPATTELRGNLETQIANVADELAYTTHDLDDGNLLLAKASQNHVKFSLLRSSFSSGTATARSYHHHRSTTGWLDIVDFFQIVHNSLRLKQRQSNNFVAQLNCSCIESRSGFRT